MKNSQDIIQRIIYGVNPITGESLDNNHFCANEQIIDALEDAIVALNKEEERKKRRENQPKNTGAKWSKELDTNLISLFEEGKGIKELSEIFERTSGAIRTRLQRLGKIKF